MAAFEDQNEQVQFQWCISHTIAKLGGGGVQRQIVPTKTIEIQILYQGKLNSTLMTASPHSLKGFVAASTEEERSLSLPSGCCCSQSWGQGRRAL